MGEGPRVLKTGILERHSWRKRRCSDLERFFPLRVPRVMRGLAPVTIHRLRHSRAVAVYHAGALTLNPQVGPGCHSCPRNVLGTGAIHRRVCGSIPLDNPFEMTALVISCRRVQTLCQQRW